MTSSRGRDPSSVPAPGQVRRGPAVSPFPKPLLLGLLLCGLASRGQLFPCFSVSAPQGRGRFLPLAWGPQQGASDIWQGLGPSVFRVLDPA